jgi:hypothetical protein
MNWLKRLKNWWLRKRKRCERCEQPTGKMEAALSLPDIPEVLYLCFNCAMKEVREYEGRSGQRVMMMLNPKDGETNRG